MLIWQATFWVQASLTKPCSMFRTSVREGYKVANIGRILLTCLIWLTITAAVPRTSDLGDITILATDTLRRNIPVADATDKLLIGSSERYQPYERRDSAKPTTQLQRSQSSMCYAWRTPVVGGPAILCWPQQLAVI